MKFAILILITLMVMFTGIVTAQDNDSCNPNSLSTLVNNSYESFQTRVEETADSQEYLTRLSTLRDTLSEIIDGCASSNRVDDGSPGTGTINDPFRFGIFGNIGDGMLLKVDGLIRPADALVRSYNSFNPRAGAGQQYVIVKVTVQCEQGGSSSCSTSYFDYKLVGSRGIVYDSAFVVNDNDLDVELFPGSSSSGELNFLIDSSDTDLMLIHEELFSFTNSDIFFEAQPSQNNGLQILAISNVNVRNSPSTNAAVVGSLQANTSEIAFGRNEAGTWIQLSTGWIFADLVTVEGDIQQLPITSQ